MSLQFVHFGIPVTYPFPRLILFARAYFPAAYFYFEAPSVSGGGAGLTISRGLFCLPALIFFRGLFFPRLIFPSGLYC